MEERMTSRREEAGRKEVYGREGVEGWSRALNGKESELGIWPDERPARGSGAVPVHL